MYVIVLRRAGIKTPVRKDDRCSGWGPARNILFKKQGNATRTVLA
jgi:hypothetical protein